MVADVTPVPWSGTAAPVGVTYTTTISLIDTPTTRSIHNPTYSGTPTFYISDMGAPVDPTIPAKST